MAEEKKKTDRQAYLREYQKKYRHIKIIIDTADPEQVALMNFIRSKGDTSNYLKSLVEADMKKAGE